jgi:NAD(P)H-dependent flavin oxidoreductase YrpB (nitropropane dioxygenase family)
MFASQLHHRDFADTRVLGAEAAWVATGFNSFDEADADEQLALADAADGQLLRLVASVAGVTLVLALVTSLAAA